MDEFRLKLHIKFENLKTLGNSEIVKISSNNSISSNALGTFLDLLSIKRYRNKDVNEILKILKFFIENITGNDSVDHQNCKAIGRKLLELTLDSPELVLTEQSNYGEGDISTIIFQEDRNEDTRILNGLKTLIDRLLELKFNKFGDDIEMVLPLYLNILLMLGTYTQHMKSDIFYKLYFATTDPSLSKSLRYRAYLIFKKLLVGYNLTVFIRGGHYEDFPFLEELIEDVDFQENQISDLMFYLIGQKKEYPAKLLLVKCKNAYFYNYCEHVFKDFKLFRADSDDYLVFLFKSFDRSFLMDNLGDRYLCNIFDDFFAERVLKKLESSKQPSFSMVVSEGHKINRCSTQEYFEAELNNLNTKGVIEIPSLLLFKYLRFHKQTNLDHLGNFITKNKNQKYFEMFLETFDFEDLAPLDAVRLFLSAFILPGESQLIYRVLEDFSKKYCEDQKDLKIYFKEFELPLDGSVESQASLDAKMKESIFVFLYALLALNTNLHNALSIVKPTLIQFIESLSSENLDSSLIEEAYESVKAVPFRYLKKNEHCPEDYKLFMSLAKELEIGYHFDFITKEENDYINCIGELLGRNMLELQCSLQVKIKLCRALGLTNLLYSLLLEFGTRIYHSAELKKEDILAFNEVCNENINEICYFILQNKNTASSGTNEKGNTEDSAGNINGEVLIRLMIQIFFKIVTYKPKEKQSFIFSVMKPQNLVLRFYEPIYVSFIKNTITLDSSNLIFMCNYLLSKECTLDDENFREFVIDIYFDIIVANIRNIFVFNLRHLNSDYLIILLRNCFKLGLEPHFQYVLEHIFEKSKIKAIGLAETVAVVSACDESTFNVLVECFKGNRSFFSRKLVEFLLQNVDVKCGACYDLLINMLDSYDLFDLVISISEVEIQFNMKLEVDDTKNPEGSENAAVEAMNADSKVKSTNIFKTYKFHELFESQMGDKINVVKFLTNSQNILSTNFLTKYFREHGRECICASSVFESSFRHLIYLIVKTDLMGCPEIVDYTLWIFNLCSASLPFIANFLKENFGILLQLNNQKLRNSIVKIYHSRVKKVHQGELVCVEGCIHEDVSETCKIVNELLCNYQLADSEMFNF